MGRLTLDLNKFKASGVYTIEFDASERIVLTTETVRLVVGFSKKGPFNAPVFLRDNATAKRIFGEIDKDLEAKGSFFHRSIETCLLTGPVFALNLLPLNNIPLSEGGDGTDYKSFSVNMAENNGVIAKDLLASWFDKERFWRPDTDNFIAITQNHPINRNRLLHIANLSQKSISIITRKATVSGFDITAREWFGGEDVPGYMNKHDFISDYFIELILLEGDWTDYTELSQDPTFNRYFDLRGLRIDRLDEFLALEETRTVGSFTGCLIPDFIDRNGTYQSIDTIVNNAISATGMYLTINNELLADYENTGAKIDLIGHGIIDDDTKNVNFLSYNLPLANKLEYENLNTWDYGSPPTWESDNIGESKEYDLGEFETIEPQILSKPLGGVSGFFGNTLIIPKPLSTFTVFRTKEYQEIIDNLNTNSLIRNAKTNEFGEDYLKVESVNETPNSIVVTLSNPEFLNAIDDVEIDNIEYIESPSKQVNIILKKDGNSYTDDGIIYIHGDGFWGYYELTGDGAIIDEEAALEGSSFDDLINAIENNLDLEAKVWKEDDKDFAELITGDDKLNIVFKPDLNIEDENEIKSFPFSPIGEDILENRLVNGDKVYNETDSYYLGINNRVLLPYGIFGTRIRQYENDALTKRTDVADFISFGESWSKDGETKFNNLYQIVFYSESIGDLKYEVEISDSPFYSPNNIQTKFFITEENADKVEVGYFIVNENKEYLTKIKNKKRVFDGATGTVYFEIETYNPVFIENNIITVIKPINKHADRLQFTNLHGFRLTDWHKPGTPQQLWKILEVLENTNLGKTLASDDVIVFRYLIDTFDFGIEPMMGAKSILARLAKNRQKCMAILNAPSIKKFRQSTDPRFTDAPDPDGGNPKPLLNTQYIKDGGNLTLGPSFTFSLPDEENGSKFIGVFSPFLTYRENNKNFNVPPAADVSNNFIRKFLTGQPYAITAGPRRGVISNPKLVGLEFDYSLEDRENLEPFGINPIVDVRNIGAMIFANQSAYQRTKSAFNNLHVRDLLITLEMAIEDVLKQYLFEFNAPETRLEIKSIVENFLDGVENAEGILDSDVMMDEVNNPDEIIDDKFAILDVGVEPAIGAQKFINRITVFRTGGIASGGFTLA